MSVVYLDTTKLWKQIFPLLEHPYIKKCLEVYGWWNEYPENWQGKPLMVSLKQLMMERIELTEDEIKEIDNVIENAYNHGPESIFWWSALHDCVDGNALIMGPITRLILKQEVYILGVSINGAGHQVISNRKYEIGDIIIAESRDAKSFDEPVIFDLIYPVIAKLNKNYEMDGKEIKVNSCLTLKENHEGNCYWQEGYVDPINEYLDI